MDEILMYLTKDSLTNLANILTKYKKYSTIIISSTLPEVNKISDRTFIFKGNELIENGK
jgi:ABC-type sugar transport system ATPase subunit